VNVSHKFIYIVLLFCTVVLGGSIFKDAQEAFVAGDYETAYTLFEQVEVTHLNSGPLAYNKGNCQYQLGDYDKAIELYFSVLSSDAEESLKKNANYNMGNCYYRQSQVLANEDLRKALDKINQAVNVFRKSYTGVGSEDKTAKENIALARNKAKAYIATIKYVEALQKEIEEKRKALIEKLEMELASQNGINNGVIDVDNEIKVLASTLTEGPVVHDFSKYEKKLIELAPSQRGLNNAVSVSKKDAVTLEALQEKLAPPPPPPAAGQSGAQLPQMNQQAPPKASAALGVAESGQSILLNALIKKDSSTALPAGVAVAQQIQKALDILKGEQENSDQENEDQENEEDQEQQEGEDGEQGDQQDQQDQDGQQGEQENKEGDQEEQEQEQEQQDGQEDEQEDEQEGEQSQADDEQDQEEGETSEALEPEKVPDETAKAILDKERERKEKRLKIRMRQRGKVEKDW